MKFWKERISYFLVKHPIFENSEEDIFTPREGMQIRFWFEGNLQIKGTHKDLKTITPDYPIDESFKDFIKGHDPVYDWIIKQ